MNVHRWVEKKTVSQCITSDYCKGWNDAVDAMPKWISVDEDTPINDDDVLILVGKEDIAVGWFDGYKGCWHIDSSVTGRVTHWMPRPEPPKEDT